jgi:hypothetical protein
MDECRLLLTPPPPDELPRGATSSLRDEPRRGRPVHALVDEGGIPIGLRGLDELLWTVISTTPAPDCAGGFVAVVFGPQPGALSDGYQSVQLTPDPTVPGGWWLDVHHGTAAP